MTPHHKFVVLAAALVVALATVPAAADGGDDETHHHVTPDGSESIQFFVDKADPGDTIHLHEGTFEQKVEVTTPDLTIRGNGTDATVLDGSNVDPDDDHEHAIPNPAHGHGGVDGIHVTVDGVTVRDMTIRDFGNDGVEWNGVTGFYAYNVDVVANGLYGLNAYESEIGGFFDSYGTEHPDSAFYVGEIRSCQCVVENVTAEGNLIGYSGTGASGVTIRDSTFRDNAAAIVPNVLVSDHHNEPQLHLFVHDNVIVDNNNRTASEKWHFEGTHVPPGLGVVIAGGSSNLVTDNLITGHTTAGVAVSWLFTEPSFNRIVDNTLHNPPTTDHPKAVDILWDGGGVNNCFEGNERLNGSQPSFDGGAVWNTLGRPDCSTTYATPPDPGNLARQLTLQLMGCEPGDAATIASDGGCHVEYAPSYGYGY